MDALESPGSQWAGMFCALTALGLTLSSSFLPQPWGFPAREFLRKKLIGKEVCFTVEYKTPQGREYGMVYLGKGESWPGGCQLLEGSWTPAR